MFLSVNPERLTDSYSDRIRHHQTRTRLVLENAGLDTALENILDSVERSLQHDLRGVLTLSMAYVIKHQIENLMEEAVIVAPKTAWERLQFSLNCKIAPLFPSLGWVVVVSLIFCSKVPRTCDRPTAAPSARGRLGGTRVPRSRETCQSRRRPGPPGPCRKQAWNY